MPKRVYQPKRLKRARKCGFLIRTETYGGRKVLTRRRAKARRRLTAV